MAENQPRGLEILAALAEQPATSYFEDRVSRVIEGMLSAAGLPWEQDEYGNIIARLTRPDAAGNAPRRPIALVAHMDHPGFEVTGIHDLRLTLQMRGRVSDVIYEQEIDLVIYCADGTSHRARTTGADGDMPARFLYADLVESSEVSLPAFAVFDLPVCEVRGDTIHARALDDLAGCASALSILETLATEHEPVDVIGVFTRAEEEGLIGARLLAANGDLPRETLVISVESSRTLPGAEQGSGPVIRVGDALSTFSQTAEEVLQAARITLQRRDPPVPVQRQLMSGGVCEASVFVAHGYDATGVAFPLAHYHNGFGEDAIQAENITMSDFLGGIELLLEAARNRPAALNEAGGNAPSPYARLRSVPTDEADRLRSHATRAGRQGRRL